MVLIYNCKIVLGVGSVGLTCETFIETQARSTQVGAVGRIVPPVGGGEGFRTDLRNLVHIAVYTIISFHGNLNLFI